MPTNLIIPNFLYSIHIPLNNSTEIKELEHFFVSEWAQGNKIVFNQI